MTTGLRFQPGQFQRLPKAWSVPDALDIGHDDLDVRLDSHPFESFGDVDVRLVSRRDPVVYADAALAREVGDMGSIGAALADDPKWPRLRHFAIERLRESAIKADLGIKYPEAIGAKQAQAPCPGDVYNTVLDGDALFAAFRIARREDYRATHPPLGAFPHGFLRECERQRDHGHIWHFGQIRKRFVGFEALHSLAVRVNRVNASLEAALDQVADGAT